MTPRPMPPRDRRYFWLHGPRSVPFRRRRHHRRGFARVCIGRTVEWAPRPNPFRHPWDTHKFCVIITYVTSAVLMPTQKWNMIQEAISSEVLWQYALIVGKLLALQSLEALNIQIWHMIEAGCNTDDIHSWYAFMHQHRENSDKWNFAFNLRANKT